MILNANLYLANKREASGDISPTELAFVCAVPAVSHFSVVDPHSTQRTDASLGRCSVDRTGFCLCVPCGLQSSVVDPRSTRRSPLLVTVCGFSICLITRSGWLLDGLIRLLDGSIRLSDGSIQLGDGLIKLADGLL